MKSATSQRLQTTRASANRIPAAPSAIRLIRTTVRKAESPQTVGITVARDPCAIMGKEKTAISAAPAASGGKYLLGCKDFRVERLGECCVSNRSMIAARVKIHSIARLIQSAQNCSVPGADRNGSKVALSRFAA